MTTQAEDTQTKEQMGIRDKSVEFMNALHSLLEIIEELKPNDGQYLKACKNLQILNQNRINKIIEVFMTTNVVQEHSNRAKKAERKKRCKLSETEKIKKGAVRCWKCDRVVFNIEQHQNAYVCDTTLLRKKLAVNIGNHEIYKYINSINIIRLWARKTRRYKFGNFLKFDKTLGKRNFVSA